MGIGAISAISGYSGISGIYPAYNPTAVTGVRAARGVSPESDGTAQAAVDGAKDAERSGRVKQSECQTCKNRKYQDGSDEMVSFKSAAHISPQASASRVRAHEQEHVSREQAKAKREGKEVVSQSVVIHTSVCPECGKVYVSGGTTRE